MMGVIHRKLATAGWHRFLKTSVELAGEGVEELASRGVAGVTSKIAEHFQGRHQAIADAMTSASDRSWRALELWLCDRGSLRKAFDNADDKGLLQKLDAFFRCAEEPLELHGSELAFRQRCLDELRQARKAGLLAADEGPRSPQALADEISLWGLFAADGRLADRQAEVLDQLPLVMEARCPNLAKLLRQRPNGEPPFLVAAFEYYFADALARDDALARQWTWLAQRRQNQSLDLLLQAEAQSAERWSRLFEEMASLSESIEGIKTDVSTLLSEFRLHNRMLTSRDGFSIRDDDERELLSQVRALWRGLDDNERKRHLPLLRDKIKAEFACGQFAEASADAQALVQLADAPRDRAEGHYHDYLAALERQEWDSALQTLEQAVVLNPELAPFPMRKYKAKRILGMGGFGVVFLCRDLLLSDRHHEVEVVVKTLAQEAFGDRLQGAFRDIKYLRDIHDEAIINVYDGDFADVFNRRNPYITMAYFPGETLERLIAQRGPLPPKVVIAIAERVAVALGKACEQRVLHRDVKPANIMVRLEKDNFAVKVIDFGLAQRLEVSIGSAGRAQTQREARVNGTLDYVAPEIRKGQPHTFASDVYSLGRTLFHALCGEPNPNNRQRRDLPDDLNDFLDACIDPDPSHRPQTGRDLIERLRALGRAKPQQTQTQTPSQSQSQTQTQSPPAEPRREPAKPTPVPAAPAPHGTKAGETRDDNGLKMPMIWCPPGTFTMGSPKTEVGRYDDEQQVKAQVHGFWLGKFVLTQQQWQTLTDGTIEKQQAKAGNSPLYGAGPNHPMYYVNWDEARDFCVLLTEKERAAGRLPAGWEYRLPTEAEWEYACRAGTITAYSFGDAALGLSKYAWFDENSGNTTHLVGEKNPNPWRFHDMHGNVWEWCLNAWSPTAEGGVNPGAATSASGAAERVIRGGSWYNSCAYCRSACRDGYESGYRHHTLGFRVARVQSR